MKHFTSELNLMRFKPLFFSLLALLVVFSLQNVGMAQEDDDHDHHDHSNHEAEALQGHQDEDSDHDHEGHDDHGDEHGEADEHTDHDDHGGPIELSHQDMEDFDIQVAIAGPGMVHNELRLPGEISINENAMGHVSPRFDCVVTKIDKRLGDRVKTGDVMAEMESNETLRPFTLNAPIDGTIVAFHIAPGESVPSGEVVYTVVDTSTVWADLRVYQRDLPDLHAGQIVRISAGHNYPEFEGSISYVGPVIDETTRTGLVRVVIPNAEGLYRPGLFITGNVILDEHSYGIVVPRSGVISMDGNNVVFVQKKGEEGFEARQVTLGHKDSQNVEILNGLRSGEIYVSQGGFFLKADSQKEDFGDGHAH